MKTALKEKDTELIQKKAHKLKGSTGNINAEKLAKTASQIEIAVRDVNIKEAESFFSIFVEEYDELEVLIRKKLKISQ